MSTTTTTGASAQLAPLGISDARPWATYERRSKRRKGGKVSNDGIGQNLSEDNQHEENVAYILAIDPGAEIVDFRDNRSAFTGVRRDDWQRLLAGLEAGHFKGVVGWHADRYTRQPFDLETLIRATEAGRAQLHTAMGGWHHDPTMIRIESALSWKDSKVKSDRQKLHHQGLAQVGKPHGGQRMFGWNAERTELVPDEAASVVWVADQILAGRSLRSIAEELNAPRQIRDGKPYGRGATTPRGNAWRSSNLGAYMQRPALAGLRQHGTEDGKPQGRPIVVGEASWPAILDLGKWQAVCELLRNPDRRASKSAPRRYLLSGIATCGVCGSPMRGRSAASTGHQAGYMCNGGKGKGCVHRRADLVDLQVRAFVVERLAQSDASGHLVPAVDDSRPAMVAESIRELEARQAGLVSLHLAGQLTQAQLVAGTAEAEQKLAGLRSELAGLEVEARQPLAVLEGLAAAASADAWFDALDLERQRAVVRQLVTVSIQPQGTGVGYDPALVEISWRH